MDKNDQINKFVEFSKEIIKTEGIKEETLSKISKELSKLSNIEDLFRFGNHRGRGANAAESTIPSRFPWSCLILSLSVAMSWSTHRSQ